MEMDIHIGFGSRPVDNSYHTMRKCVRRQLGTLNDMEDIDDLADGCDLRRAGNHFTYTGGG